MCHVLIIEDEWIIADHIHQLIEGTGTHSISMADTEDEAVAQARIAPPEVIVSDISLRRGSGPEAVRRIAEIHGPTPCLFVTGEPRNTLPPDITRRILRKPFADQDFIAAFVKLVPQLSSSPRSDA